MPLVLFICRKECFICLEHMCPFIPSLFEGCVMTLIAEEEVRDRIGDVKKPVITKCCGQYVHLLCVMRANSVRFGRHTYWGFSHYWDCFHCRRPHKKLNLFEKQWKEALLQSVEKITETIDFIRRNGAKILSYY